MLHEKSRPVDNGRLSSDRDKVYGQRNTGARRSPRRHGSTAADVFTALAGHSPDRETFTARATAVRNAVQDARSATAQRRERVLAHPDLVQRLQDVLGLSDARHWTGYVPPRMDPQEDCGRCVHGTCRGVTHTAPVNDSPVRAELVAIATEAKRREVGGHD